MSQPRPQKIVFFDGVCNLCNGFIDFLIKHDTQHEFKIASLQGSTAAVTLPAEVREKLKSVVLFQDGQSFYESEAVLNILSELPAPWSWLGILRVLPRGFSDSVYEFTARHRYHIFGERSSCRLPTSEEKAYFLP